MILTSTQVPIVLSDYQTHQCPSTFSSLFLVMHRSTFSLLIQHQYILGGIGRYRSDTDTLPHRHYSEETAIIVNKPA